MLLLTARPSDEGSSRAGLASSCPQTGSSTPSRAFTRPETGRRDGRSGSFTWRRVGVMTQKWRGRQGDVTQHSQGRAEVRLWTWVGSSECIEHFPETCCVQSRCSVGRPPGTSPTDVTRQACPLCRGRPHPCPIPTLEQKPGGRSSAGAVGASVAQRVLLAGKPQPPDRRFQRGAVESQKLNTS